MTKLAIESFTQEEFRFCVRHGVRNRRKKFFRTSILFLNNCYVCVLKKNDGHCFFVMGYGMLGDGLTNLINECVGAALF